MYIDLLFIIAPIRGLISNQKIKNTTPILKSYSAYIDVLYRLDQTRLQSASDLPASDLPLSPTAVNGVAVLYDPFTVVSY
jgi:hypothetical protein